MSDEEIEHKDKVGRTIYPGCYIAYAVGRSELKLGKVLKLKYAVPGAKYWEHGKHAKIQIRSIDNYSTSWMCHMHNVLVIGADQLPIDVLEKLNAPRPNS